MVAKLQRDKDRRIQEKEAEINQLRESIKEQQRAIKDAGWNLVGDVKLGGKDDVKEASNKINELTDRIMTARKELAAARRDTSVDDYRANHDAANKDALAAVKKRRTDLREQGEKEFAQTDPKLWLAYLKKQQAETQKKISDATGAVNFRKNELRRATGDDERRKQMDLLVAAENKLQTAREKIYDLDKQICLIEKDAREKEKADRKNLAKNLTGQAYSLQGQLMVSAGQGKQFEIEQALRSAKEQNGGRDLDAKQTEMVTRLATMAYEMRSGSRDIKAADPGTNSLTARGGFAGGVRQTDPDQYNRIIASNAQKQVTALNDINKLLKDLTTI